MALLMRDMMQNAAAWSAWQFEGLSPKVTDYSK